MVSVSAQRNADHLKLMHPRLFTDICHSHAGRLLGITDRLRVADLVGDIQDPIDDSSASRVSLAGRKKLYRGINFAGSLACWQQHSQG